MDNKNIICFLYYVGYISDTSTIRCGHKVKELGNTHQLAFHSNGSQWVPEQESKIN